MEEPILSWVLTGVSAVLGWFCRELWNAVKDLKDDMGLLREHISSTYVRRDEVKELKTEIISHLIRIETKLDQKQDK